jgi:SAM-dependent methyltransferase
MPLASAGRDLVSMQVQLLSPRFGRVFAGRSIMPLSDRQQMHLKEVRRAVNAGLYRLVVVPCPCGDMAAGDVQIAEIDRYGLELRSVLCRACGTVRIDPYLDAPSLDDFYANRYQEMYGRSKNLPHLFTYQLSHYGERIAELYAELSPHAAVLEVGCGTGGATIAFRQRGCFAAGCDLSDDLINYGISRGLDQMWVGPIDCAPPEIAARRFDLIYLFHVLEHVSQPASLLEQLRGKLAPGGRILAVVPDLFGIAVHRNPAGDCLKFIHIAHKYNFSVDGLACVARQAGLSARRIAPPPRDEAALDDGRHLAELWMEFSPAAVEISVKSPRAGDKALPYLVRTEQLFLAGQCPAQIDIAGRAAPNVKLRHDSEPPTSKSSPRWYERLAFIASAGRYVKYGKKRSA